MSEREMKNIEQARGYGGAGRSFPHACLLHQAKRTCSRADTCSLLSRLPGICRDTSQEGSQAHLPPR